MTPVYEPDRATTEPERRAERLGFALQRLAGDLADERRKVAALRRQVAELTSRLEDSDAASSRERA